MPYLLSMEGVNNPRPGFLEAHRTGKQGMMHWVYGNRKSACGNALFISGFLSDAGQSTAFDKIEDNVYLNNSLLCGECEEVFKNASSEVHDSE